MAKVLLIDDDEDMVAINKAALSKRGHKVQAAYSAKEAREALKKARPDVVVLDVMMETMSAGFDLAREIHQNDPELPVLILSGVEKETGVGFKGMEDDTWMPVVKFLDKPVAPEKLAEEVDAAMGK